MAALKQKLQQRFEPACREEAFRAELRIRQRRRNETPSEFGHAIKNLVTKAYTPNLTKGPKKLSPWKHTGMGILKET